MAGRLLGRGTLSALLSCQHYRFLTIPQFARVAGCSSDHAGEVLRGLAARNIVGYFGFVSIPGHGRTPKVYFLKRRGWELLIGESDYTPEEIGRFVPVTPDTMWTPQMYHRLRLLDLVIALEVAVRQLPHIRLVKTFIEYRRVKPTHARETTDFVSDAETPDNRIVPDGAFILENYTTGRRALFFIEMDMGTERIATKTSRDTSATIIRKLTQYDAYLTSGRFARTYSPFGDFRSFLLLFVTYGRERITNIRRAAGTLSPRLHGYYRFADFPDANTHLLGSIWQSRDSADPKTYPIVESEGDA